MVYKLMKLLSKQIPRAGEKNKMLKEWCSWALPETLFVFPAIHKRPETKTGNKTTWK